MEIKLFDHNEQAYKKLEEFLENNQRGSIDHATGTGKSFITLKYLYNHKEKRILYLTPTYYIFTQLKEVHMPKLGINKDDFIKLDNIIYRGLLNKDMEEMASQYDIIVLDEYHRCGASLWGTKVTELLNIIKDKYPEKKVIGLTATPTRYLDNERDMNEEIFFGNAVSTLTLGDAILQGLLKPPTYFNTANSHIDYLECVKSKLLRKIVYEEDREQYKNILESVTNAIQENIKLNLDDKIELPIKNGKYIVFCSKISDIEKNMKIIGKKFKNRDLSFYQVHSNQTIERNEAQLRRFREENETDNFIFVVDSLNEGIHVDNIDGIFLMRKTKSPIIYFQQLGRLLSYSTVQKKLIVWDMVDNINNHYVIYNLYNEVINEAKRRLETDKNNKERYEQIISNFQIIDNYTDVMSKIRVLEQKIDNISEEQLLNLRISRFIDILCHQYKTGSNLSKKVQVSQIFKAYDDLFKYYKYITLEQFIKLKELNIKLPNEINVSKEEFENILMGFNTIHDKELSIQMRSYNMLKDYIEKIGKVPTILSNNLEEQNYAYYIFNAINNCDNKIKKMYKDLINRFARNNFDIYYYFGANNNINCKLLCSALDYCVLNNILVNKNIYIMFTKMFSQPKIRKEYQLDKYIGKLRYKYDIKNKTKILNIEKVYEKEKKELEHYALNLEKLKKYGLESINYEEVKLFVEKYVQELLDFITVNKRYPHSGDELEFSKYTDFRFFIDKYGFKKILDDKLSQTKMLVEETIVEEIIEFMMNNKGDYPSDRVLEKKELELAKKIKKYEFVLKYYSLKLDELQKNIRKQCNDNWFFDYINFIKENGRYPILQSNDNFEVELIARFLRNEKQLTKDQKNIIKMVIKEIGETEIIKRTFLERKKTRSR